MGVDWHLHHTYTMQLHELTTWSMRSHTHPMIASPAGHLVTKKGGQKLQYLYMAIIRTHKRADKRWTKLLSFKKQHFLRGSRILSLLENTEKHYLAAGSCSCDYSFVGALPCSEYQQLWPQCSGHVNKQDVYMPSNNTQHMYMAAALTTTCMEKIKKQIISRFKRTLGQTKINVGKKELFFSGAMYTVTRYGFSHKICMDRRGDLWLYPRDQWVHRVLMNKEAGKQIQPSTPAVDCVTHYRSVHITVTIIISRY